MQQQCQCFFQERVRLLNKRLLTHRHKHTQKYFFFNFVFMFLESVESETLTAKIIFFFEKRQYTRLLSKKKNSTKY